MTGLLSSLFAVETVWSAPSALALTAATVLAGWWLGVVLRTVRDHDEHAHREDLVEPRLR